MLSSPSESQEVTMFKFTIREVVLLTVIVGLSLGWWLDRRHIASELAALRRANELAKSEPRFMIGESVQTEKPASTLTGQQFIKALRETRDWYEFADRTADPFVKTSTADEALPELIALLGDSDQEVRTRAACTLGKMKRKPDRIVPPLIPLLEDEVPNVRWHAAFAIQQFGPEAKSAIPALMKQVDTIESPIAAFAADVIQSIDPDANMEASLIRLLRHTTLENRRRAVAGLTHSSSERVKAALVDAFEREMDSELKDGMATLVAAIDLRLNSDRVTSPKSTDRQ